MYGTTENASHIVHSSVFARTFVQCQKGDSWTMKTNKQNKKTSVKVRCIHCVADIQNAGFIFVYSHGQTCIESDVIP